MSHFDLIQLFIVTFWSHFRCFVNRRRHIFVTFVLFWVFSLSNVGRIQQIMVTLQL